MRKVHLLFLIVFVCSLASAQNLNVKWIHGSEPCSANTDPPFQIHSYTDDTILLSENKCIN